MSANRLPGVSFIGLGWWGEVLAGAAQASGAVSIAGGYARTPATRAGFAAKYGCRDYGALDELLGDPACEAVVIASANAVHKEQAVAAARAGKHVHLEKPMALSVSDAQEIVAVCAEAGVKLSIGQNFRRWPMFRHAKKMIDAGELGNIYHARATEYRRRGRPYVDGYGTARFVQKEQAGGGALYDMGIYEISRMLYLLGNPRVERIVGRTYAELEMDEERGREFDVEEFATGSVFFEGGLTMDIVSAWAINLNEFSPSYIVGSQGGLRVDPFSFHKTIADIDFDMNASVDAVMGRRSLMNPQRSQDMSSSQLHWAAALHGRVELLSTTELALNTMLIQQGIYLSSERGAEVTADEVRTASVSTAVDV